MLDNIINNKTIIVSLLTFFVGALLGHWLSLGRDRRKEFNELSRETYRSLCSQIQNRRIEMISIDTAVLSHYFWYINRRRFLKAANKYKNTNYHFGEYNTNTGTVTPNNMGIDIFIQNAKTLSKFLKPR